MKKIVIPFICESDSHKNTVQDHTVEYLGHSIKDKQKYAVLKCRCEKCFEEARKQSKPTPKTIKMISISLWHNYCDKQEK